MDYSRIQQVAPTEDFKNSYASLSRLNASMLDFLAYESTIANQFAGLSGSALQIAMQIQGSLLPRLQTDGGQVLGLISEFHSDLQNFGRNFARFCDFFSNPALGPLYLEVLLNEANDFSAQLKILSARLDDYHTTMNDLITALSNEQNALTQQNAALAAERQQIIDRIKSRTTTVCGVIHTIVDSITFQLQRDLQQESQELAQANAQYRANSVGIGRITALVSQVEDYRGSVEQQQQFWTNLNTNLAALQSDLSGFQSDPSDAAIYFEAIKEDWVNLASTSPPPGAVVANYQQQPFGFDGCPVSWGPLLKNVALPDMMRLASQAQAKGFTFQPSLGFGQVMIGDYPEGCQSAANMSWPLFLLQA